MKIFTFGLSLIIILGLIPSTVFALDVEFGYKRLMPRLGVGVQEYENRAGDKYDIKPVINNTVLGNSLFMAIKVAPWSVDYEQSQYTYESEINASNSAVTADTEIESITQEKRLGVNYHLERELAGIYTGLGVSSVEEVLTSSGDEWRYATTTPYFKFGVDLIFGGIRLRYEQIHLSVGAHTVRINSMAALLSF